MPEIEVIKEMPLTMAELKEKLAHIKKNHDLSFRATKALEYLNTFAKQKPKEAEDMRKKIQDLNIIRLKETHIVKIIDLQPKDADSLKAILANENVTLRPEDMKRVIECVQ
jgi:DNA-directed RNA polymerase subunit F